MKKGIGIGIGITLIFIACLIGMYAISPQGRDTIKKVSEALKEDNTVSNTVVDNTVTNETIKETMTENPARDLTAKELEFFKDYFDDMSNNGFLTCEYTKPSEIDLKEVLYNGAGINEEMTETEKQDYLNEIGGTEFYTDCDKFTTANINKYLTEKAGITLDKVTKQLTYKYLEKYDSYYHMHGDTNYVPIKCNSGEINKDGLYIINYSGYGSEYEVTLKKVNNSYMFISNIKL